MRRPMKVFVDGNFVDEKKAVVSVFDHGLLYGDGVFEGIRAYNGRVFKLSEHVELGLKLLDPSKLNLLLRGSGDLHRMLQLFPDKDRAGCRSL